MFPETADERMGGEDYAAMSGYVMRRSLARRDRRLGRPQSLAAMRISKILIKHWRGEMVNQLRDIFFPYMWVLDSVLNEVAPKKRGFFRGSTHEVPS